MKSAILLLAWGAGSMLARQGLSHFEAQCRIRFPHCPIRWAYTSERLRDRIIDEKRKADSTGKALFRLYYERFQSVTIQPLQVIPGSEFVSVKKAVEKVYKETGLICSIGEPLLGKREKLEKTAKALLAHIPEQRKPEENVIYMGHGGRSAGVEWYSYLDEEIGRLDKNVLIGTMGGKNDLAALMSKLTSPRIWLIPLLVTLGKHAYQDMAGNGTTSWKSQLELAGFECLPVIKGLAASPLLANLWLDNLEAARADLQSTCQ